MSESGYQEILQHFRAFFQHERHPDMVCVYLYGSMARGEARQTSDVDLAVLYAVPPPSTLEGIGGALTGQLEQLLARPVDLLILNHAPPDLSHRVLRDGILVYDADPAARIRFEVQARNDYFDLLPYLRAYRRQAMRASA